MDQIDLFARELNSDFPGTGIFFGEPMSRHTTFRIGGTVSLYAEPKSIEAFVWAVREAKRLELAYLITGNGSNLLVVLCGNHDAQPVVNSGTLY